jgi:L,D-transpeptidase YcbB
MRIRSLLVYPASVLAIVGLLALSASLDVSKAQPETSPIAQALQRGTGFTPAEAEGLRRFYRARQDAPAWFDTHGLNADGRAALAIMASAAEEALDPARYEVAALGRPFTASDPDARTARDLAFSAAVLRYTADMADGRPDWRRIDSDIDLPASGLDLAGGLAEALAAHRVGDFLHGLAPQLGEYAALKAALAQYRAIAAHGGWGVLGPMKSFTAASAAPAALDVLQARLAFEDSAVTGHAPAAPDAIDAAIRRFQVRHGVEADGRVGTATQAMLDVTASERAAAIAANMERLRWLPRERERSYVQVNVPDATLKVVDDGREILSSRVIVGRPKDRTPIFRAEITGIVANPPWIVPAVIARREIAPKAAANPNYLARNHMVVVNGQYRQLPGDDNALGHVKLNVSDRFSVYLHDTPARSLFARSVRFLSHGCVRVQQIMPLASYALSGDASSGIEQLNAAIATARTTSLTIKAPLPIYVVYETVFPSTDGLQFRADIYGRDQRLIVAMNGTTSFSRNFPPRAACRRQA